MYDIKRFMVFTGLWYTFDFCVTGQYDPSFSLFDTEFDETNRIVCYM